MRTFRPPAFISFLLRIILPRSEHARVIGDLEEEYLDLEIPRRGRLGAWRWYWREGLSLLGAYSAAMLKKGARRDISVVLDARRLRRHSRHYDELSEGMASGMEKFAQDMRYALRSLRKQPRFLVAATLTLAIGIGANTAIFSVLNGVVLKPLPYEEPGQLVRVEYTPLGGENSSTFLTGLDFLDLRAQSRSFEYVASYYDYRERGHDLTGGDQPRRVISMPISADYFAALGRVPVLGRNFSRDEERPDSEVVIISHRLWEQLFAGSPSAIGESIQLDGLARIVVGIAPSDFREPFGRSVDVWTPENLVPEGRNSRDNYYLSALGRLRAGVAVETAQAEVDVIAAAIDEQGDSRGDPWTLRLIPLDESVVGGAGLLIYILLAAVGFVLLIACVNVANLFLVRSALREREFAIRSALGSSRIRLIRQSLAESMAVAGHCWCCDPMRFPAWMRSHSTSRSSDSRPVLPS
jgi:predicted permease